jgi:class 3 adenylate cyclase
MPPLAARDRAALPNSAFAYVDSHGRRRLPINDVGHVRAALARFGQVDFEDEAARERARKRLLAAAKRHGIMPIGFLTRELSGGATGGADVAAMPRLPRGTVTFLLTDIEGSTALVEALGDDYAVLLGRLRQIQLARVRQHGGSEVDARGDEYFAVFGDSAAALRAALAIQEELAGTAWPSASIVRVRAGIHRGAPALTSVGYVGVDVHIAARVADAAHGGQILLSAPAHLALLAAAEATGGVAFRDIGRYRLRGLREPQQLFQVDGPGVLVDFPALRGAIAT